jgi:phage gp45-like
MDPISALHGLYRGLRARVDGMVSRAVVELVNDGLKTQRVQLTLLGDDAVDDVEHAQPYGLSFVPPAGSQAVALAVGGVRSYTIALCADHPGERPTGAQPREGGLYSKGKWRLFIDQEGVVCLGDQDSTEHLLLGDALVQMLQTHTHPTSMGPSGPPLEQATFPNALSQHKVAP